MAPNSIYIYGIIDGKISADLAVGGIGEPKSKVYPITYKDVTVIVSDTPFAEYDPTEENTLAHEKVIQEVLQAGFSIAPMRFCTILKNKDEIFKLCQSCYMPFKKNILKIRGKQEFGVKVFLNVDKVQDEVKNGDELLQTSHLMAEELYNLLKSHAFDTVLDEQVTREMILNATLLVKKDAVEKLFNSINDFDQKYTDKLKIRISGPTAPYSFVDMPTKPM